jgi:hypothetical protein
MSKVLQERGYKSLPSSTETNPRDHVKAITTTKEIVPNAPFPRRLKNGDVLKPQYFFKSLISVKRLLKEKARIEEEIKAAMKEECSATDYNALPHKEKDPGSFTLPCSINDMSFNNALADLGASVSVMPFRTFTSLGLGKLAPTKLIIELADRTVKQPVGIAENILVTIEKFVFLVDFIILDMPENINIPLILGRHFLSTAHAKIDVFKRKISLRVGNDKLVYKCENPIKSIIRNVYMLGLREREDLDLEARFMGEILVHNRSLNPYSGDYIDLNDLDTPLGIDERSIVDSNSNIDEETVDMPRLNAIFTKNCDEFDGYPSFCDYGRRIHVECAYNLQFPCMIGYKQVSANFFPILPINVMSKTLYNSIMKNKVEYRGNNVVGAFINVPIFVGRFVIVKILRWWKTWMPIETKRWVM